MSLPSGTIVAETFGGIGSAADGYYSVLVFDKADGERVYVALPPDQLSAVVSSACMEPLESKSENGIRQMLTYPARDASIAPAIDGSLVLRLGFLEASNIQIRLGREAAIEFSQLLVQAAAGQFDHR